MSHVADMCLEVNDLNALDEACKELGLELVRGQTTYKWWGYSVGDYPLPAGFTTKDLGKCDHAIRIPNNHQAYEIGVVARKDGKPGYTLLWDFYAGGYGMQEKVGKDGGLLKQHYSIQRAKKHAQKLGKRTRIVKMANGNLQLRSF